MARMRHLEAVTVRKGGGGKGGRSKASEVSSAEGWSEEEQEIEACEKKGKGKCSVDEDGDEDDDFDSPETPANGEGGTDGTDDGGYWSIIEGAEESVPPSDESVTESPVVETGGTNPGDLPVATSAPTPSVAETEIPTFKPSAALPVVSTEAPVASTLAPTFGVTSTTDDQPSSTGSSGDGIFDGQDFFDNRLVPFAVSIEGDDVSNDLGITSCLLTEMQRNMSSLFNIEMENFTIVEYEDADGDGFKTFNLYFDGFGEYVGEFFTEEYSQEVQLNVIGDGVEFFQTCLDSRWGDSGRSFTASQLDYNPGQQGGQSQGNNVDGIQGNEAADNTESKVGDDDSKLETNLIIGLVVAGVVVALAGIVFASRVLRGNRETEDENSKLMEGQEEEN